MTINQLALFRSFLGDIVARSKVLFSPIRGAFRKVAMSSHVMLDNMTKLDFSELTTVVEKRVIYRANMTREIHTVYSFIANFLFYKKKTRP